MEKTILIVEDDPNISELVQMYLEKEGYHTKIAADGGQGVTLFRQVRPDLVLLDIMLPVMDGWSVLRTIRQDSKTPVIMLTAKGETNDKVQGLKQGADDYLTKPFGTEELLARIRAAIRHTRTPDGGTAVANSGVFTAGELTIDYGKHRVFIAGVDANLTQNEYKLVALLGLHAGKVLTYDYLIKELWGPSARSDNQILRVNMANIRRKIEKNPAQPVYIFTEAGVGYRMIEGD